MKEFTVWKSPEARARLEAWYERFRSKITAPVKSRKVATSLGPSHVLVAGSPSNPPLVCLHAMRTGAAHLVSELGPLLDRFQVYAPDLPGQSVRGPQVQLSVTDDSHARWLEEVLNGLHLGRVPLFGISWGGFVARLMASTYPERIDRLALLVPAGIVIGSVWKGLFRLAIPMLRYRFRPTEANLRRLFDPLFTVWDEDWAYCTADSISDMRLDPRIPPVASDAELARLTMPLLVLGAELDLSFPGEKLVRRVKSVLPNAETEVIPKCKHGPPTTPEFRHWLADRLTGFLTPEPRV